jgi:hypothetical protein
MNFKSLLPMVLLTGWAVAEPVDLVAKGGEAFHLWGCAECHAVAKGDDSIKSGPSLYNLFTTEPRQREVADAEGHKRAIKADRAYFMNSVRNPGDDLAVAEVGATKGTAYPPIMPKYVPEIVSDAALETIWHYLRHQAEEGKNGPAKVMGEMPVDKKGQPWENPAEILVDERVKVLRAPLMQSSGRAIHVGLPSGMSYSFDPRFLSVRSVWSGGFLNLSKEQQGRSTPGSDRGHGAQQLLDGKPLLSPLTPTGQVVDFEFKEPDVNDDDAAIRHLEKGGDFLKELASWDAAFLGYAHRGKEAPQFYFRVGKNKIAQSVSFSTEGDLVVEISGTFATEQVFQVRTLSTGQWQAESGKLDGERWVIPAGEKATHRLRVSKMNALAARQVLPKKESFAAQPLVKNPAQADLPAGYSIEDWQAPLDGFGRKILFEPTAIAVAKNGTVVVGTRTAGIWRLKDQKWQIFAEGTYECLGIVIEDDAGDTIVITQKPELTRIRDIDADGLADRYETLCDDFGFHGNYHEYNHGPARDAAGNYYFALNLSHNNNERASYKAGGNFMGSMGGFRGWACRVTPEGVFEPYANGLRSPAGIGMSPDGRLLAIDNQGEYYGSSKMSFLKQGAFYGHPSGLVTLPGMKPSSPEIAFDLWKEKTIACALWFPHGRWANSPGNPAWDLTDGKFGPFAEQMFVGDQALSTLMRVQFEKVGEVDQGTMVMFSRQLASGVMRPTFLPDGSLLLGQTGRGWQSKGGSQASLQHVVWDGKTVPAEIRSIKTEADGFLLNFTLPLKESVSQEDLLAALTIESWSYTDSVKYGSAENDKRKHSVTKVEIAADRKSLRCEIADFSEPQNIINRLHQVKIRDAKKWWGDAARPEIEAYQTVRDLPK